MHSDWLKKHSKSTDHVLVFKTKVSHFRVKNTPLKSSNEGSAFFFCGLKKSFCSRNRPSRNLTMVSSRRREKCALFRTSIKAATFLKAVQVQFFLYGQENYIKGIFVRINVSQTFYNFLHRC